MSSNHSENPEDLILLIVEEDDGVRRLLKSVLPQFGFGVLIAANGKEALELYAQHSLRIGLVLMDVNMTGLSGMETFGAMQEMNAGVRCCFMSGDTSASRWPDLLRMGGLCVIEKPFRSLHELSQTLKMHLSGSQ